MNGRIVSPFSSSYWRFVTNLMILPVLIHLQTFQSYTQFKEIPRKLIVSKRLAQCLNPALPTGVHQWALEVYVHILSVIGVGVVPIHFPRSITIFLAWWIEERPFAMVLRIISFLPIRCYVRKGRYSHFHILQLSRWITSTASLPSLIFTRQVISLCKPHCGLSWSHSSLLSCRVWRKKQENSLIK
jgi:hypothetical protein